MESKEVLKAVEYLKSGKVGIFPTDTAFGIGCRMNDERAVKRIFQIRNRPKEKALLVLVSSVKMAEEYVFINSKVRKELIKKYWPGALTIILKCKPEKVLNTITANTDTLAIRLPDHKILREIIEKIGVPIIAPSANFSGKPTPFELSEIDERLKSKVDFILPGVCTMKDVSTIIDCTKKPWKIVRQGVAKIGGVNF